ncbi:MAG: HAMP domain-containing protein [Paucibacter sp.]|nr:HAMP domain-containing protein [Roseateles sp.]
MKSLSIQARLVLLVALLMSIALLGVVANLMGRYDGVARLHAMNTERVQPLAALIERSALKTHDEELTRASAELLAKAKAEDEESRSALRTVMLRNAVLFGALLGVSLWLAWRQIRAISQPIHAAVSLAEAVADGRLDQQIESRGPAETRLLLDSLSRMSQSLKAIVTEVRDNSASLATGSAEIASGNADLSRRTETQASNLEETAASMEELSATVRQNAEAALRADTLSGQVAQSVQTGHEQVSEMGRTMGQIAAASTRIGDIIGTIDGIAFQTNILALNAAVEAARAGEQGRGFAVVAGEVRNLAQRAAGAAREVRQLVQDSQARVAAGSQQAGQAVESMGRIVEQMRQVGALIGEISTGSGEQAKGIAEIGSAVSQLDEVTQQNAALVEQSAAAAESLRGQAQRLSTLVARFELGAA